MTAPKRDEETGQVKWNGKLGAALAWLEWAGKLLLLPVVLYLAAHEIRHARVDDFMSTGPRLTPAMLENRLDLYKSDVIQYVSNNYPPDALVSKVDELARGQAELRVQVGRIDERTKAIQTILESD